MDKRTFLRTSALLVGGTVLSRLTACRSAGAPAASPAGPAPLPGGAPRANWAGNVRYGAARVHYPETVEQVQRAVTGSRAVRAVGTRHSFNHIADCDDAQVSLRRLNRVVSLDRAMRTVTVEGGMTYAELAPYLHAHGFALHNLASLPHVSIAGACATATHGSGSANGNLATAVSAIEFVDGTGELVTLSRARDGDRFRGAVVGLGGLGIVTKLTLDLQPTFDMAQVVYRNLPMQALERDFAAVMASGYSVSLFTDWTRKNVNQVWIKRRVGLDGSIVMEPELLGARRATRDMHPLDDQSPEPFIAQMGVPGPWYARMPHFRMEFVRDSGEELQSEYFVPLEHAFAAMMAIEGLHERITPHLYVSEIRTVAADELWMSPCHGRACVAFHTTWRPRPDEVARLLPLVEERLAPFSPVPHWGKLFAMSPATVQSRFPRLADFRALLARHDPEGRFGNEFLRRYVHGA